MHYRIQEEEEVTSSQDHEDLMEETLLKLCFDQSGWVCKDEGTVG